ncbi:MAG TPA: hypothetical protein VGO11_09705 [Chthoniobacteraceae bacterium]|nr:hypothetical protein [Chthoniobacteraceae bacterium]
MKTAPLRPCRLALALGLLAFFSLRVPAQAGPAISAKRALELAEEALAAKNAGDNVFIQSVALQRTSLVSGKPVWTVSWSENLPASKPGSVEVGVEIRMDGSVVHLVKGRAAPGKAPVLPH